MNLLSTPTAIAAQINQINQETLSFLKAQLSRAHDLANTEGQQSQIMEAFGVNAVSALRGYAVLYAALTELGSAGSLTAPNFSVFQPQIDGRVLYVAPIIEEDSNDTPNSNLPE